MFHHWDIKRVILVQQYKDWSIFPQSQNSLCPPREKQKIWADRVSKGANDLVALNKFDVFGRIFFTASTSSMHIRTLVRTH